MLFFTYMFIFLLSVINFYYAYCSIDEEKLIKTLFKGYNKLIRPVKNSSDHVEIAVDLVLLQLINVYEKEQIMKTNVWVNMKWHDFQLEWSADDNKIKSIRVPFERVWTPDIVLFNNADGNYEASYKSNAVVYAEKPNILLVPPAIYQSSCTIDVTYFPFDEQECDMRFGSWTFDAKQVQLVPEKPSANLDDYLPSGTWDVIDAPAQNITYEVDGVQRMELVYKFRIRRKTLFYTVNLIIPTVLISFLSIFVFYLPTDEGEKMTLCISILLALVVFLLLVSKILPPTSIVIPLIAKYLLFTLIMNIVTILNTVIIINWNYRTPRTHNMPRWVRFVFTEFLPKILFMQRRTLSDENHKQTNIDDENGLEDDSQVISNNTSNHIHHYRHHHHRGVNHSPHHNVNNRFNSPKIINSTHNSDYEISIKESNNNEYGANFKNHNVTSSPSIYNSRLNNTKTNSNKDNNFSLINSKSNNVNRSSPQLHSNSPSSTLKQHHHNKHQQQQQQHLSNGSSNTTPIDNCLNKHQSTKTHQKQQQHLYLSSNLVKKSKKNQLNNETNLLTTDEVIVNNNRIHSSSSSHVNILQNNSTSNLSNNKNKSYDKYANKSHSFDSDLLDEQVDSSEEYNQDILDAADKVAYITNHIKSENDYQEVRDDWKYVALVIDRLQLYLFFSVTVIGTACILLRAPYIFDFVDQQEILRKLRELNKSNDPPI